MTSCWNVFAECVRAKAQHEEILSKHDGDKEFHFQHWFQARLDTLGLLYTVGGRNKYPDFALQVFPEGYEVKGLETPGREADYDSNSQVPTGIHGGNAVFYVFGRYPKKMNALLLPDGTRKYPVTDLVIVHGDFLNTDRTYVHENKSFRGFGNFGDLMVRDRKMYVAPTPFASLDGTDDNFTLVVPAHYQPPAGFFPVGAFERVEVPELVESYGFDLWTNTLQVKTKPNPTAGAVHKFVAYRQSGQSASPVNLRAAPI